MCYIMYALLARKTAKKDKIDTIKSLTKHRFVYFIFSFEKVKKGRRIATNRKHLTATANKIKTGIKKMFPNCLAKIRAVRINA